MFAENFDLMFLQELAGRLQVVIAGRFHRAKGQADPVGYRGKRPERFAPDQWPAFREAVDLLTALLPDAPTAEKPVLKRHLHRAVAQVSKWN